GKWTIPGNYQANKKSALYSACLDLSGVPRPVISFRSNLNLSDGEGIVLQYSKDSKNIQDPGKAWSVLGTTPDETSNPSPGIEWYNKAGLASNPGTGYANSSNAKGYGWSGKPGRSEPKHKLEDITNPQNPLPNNRVILRFAFSSLNAGGNGITIDSVRVGSRTRTILFENFTTTDIGSAPSALNDVLKSEADSIRKFTNANINSTQLVNINYHVDFLGKDPFNALNEADQGSRALYYNVNQVPYAFLDGVHNQYKNSSDLFQNWGQGAYDLQTLNLANADFRIASNPTKVTTNNTDGTIEVEVNVTPTKDLPKSTKLFVAVLEDQILKGQLPGTPSITTGETEFNYVLRKMLPNAVGTRYPDGTFKSGTSVRLGANGKVNAAADKFTWSVNKVFGSKLSVVVFLQDSTKGVYQADLFQNVAIPSNLITGIEPLSPERVNIYPNPANQEFTIELPKALSVDANVSLVDQMGRTLDGGLIPAGRTNKSVGTYELAAGVYIVQIKTDGGEVVRKKVVIVH
ncbi:MAG: T9SS type A sorting domain-containing protein, partial [Bacteroidetes bacterium]|nr:T9SS type A sorting domain-containing protein [Bacteroidota bacterium]